MIAGSGFFVLPSPVFSDDFDFGLRDGKSSSSRVRSLSSPLSNSSSIELLGVGFGGSAAKADAKPPASIVAASNKYKRFIVSAPRAANREVHRGRLRPAVPAGPIFSGSTPRACLAPSPIQYTPAAGRLSASAIFWPP